ncbi:MAG: virulence RhuM family protein [Thiomargarita sp.]|nr:virulence RhuM family protein [Thiomargarita sp.]
MENESEIVLYKNQDGNIEIDVHLEHETVWLTQEQIALLFNKSKSTINEHIKNIFKEGELTRNSTVRNFRIVRLEGNRNIERNLEHYNLDVIISVGYRVKSKQGTQFRIWATQRLKEHIVKGFTLNDKRFKSGNSMNYFNELQERIREIRLSERVFYQKIKDIYSTSIDYDPKNEKTIEFFKIVQNKLLWAISEQTAAELVYRRVDAKLPLIGMQSFDKESSDKIRKNDISVAKNYLKENEIKLLGLLVEQYLAFAEMMAQQQKTMYMRDWGGKLDDIIQLNEKELLTHAGKISQKMAKEKSSMEYNKYKEMQRKIEHENNLKEIENDIKRLNKK